MRKFGLYLSLILVLSACKQESERSIYVWKTTFDLQKSDINFLKSNKITKLYIRFFDISVSEHGRPYPKAPIRSTSKLSADFEVVPVVFIENESLKKIPIDSIESLSKSILTKIEFLAKTELEITQLSEIQLDCDWSKSTKAQFFKLVESIKKQSAKKISVTVRLYQLKYPEQTGVPPADCGVLMYYNMGQLKNPDERNSILNNEIGEKYLTNAKQYPIELSLALPVFSWSVLFRAGKFQGILNNLSI